MKKDKIFKSLLLSQEDIAMLLGITRSQWAMYEIRQRDIPSTAKLKLATLLKQVNALSKEAKKEWPYQKSQEALKQKMLLDQLEDNKLEQLRVQRKLDQLERNYKEAENTIQFVTFLKEKESLSELDALVLNTVQNKALTTLEKNGMHLQTKQQLKLNVLVALTKVLEKELR